MVSNIGEMGFLRGQKKRPFLGRRNASFILVIIEAAIVEVRHALVFCRIMPAWVEQPCISDPRRLLSFN